MPQVETGFYGNVTPINLSNITEGIQEAQKMKFQQQQMAQAQQAHEQQSQMNALRLSDMGRNDKVAQDETLFKQGVAGAAVVDPATGRISYDQGKLSDLGKQFPLQSQAFQQQQAAQQHAMEQQKIQDLDASLKLHGQIFGSVNDEASFQSAKLLAQKHDHFSADAMPDHYDPNWVKQQVKLSMTPADQVAKQIDQQKADAETKNAETKAGELPIRQREADAKIQENSIRNAERKDAHGNQQMQQVQSMLESARGNPEVAQAQKDRYAASKLNSLLGDDPNKLSPAQVQLAASEVAKIATGGVPTSAELQHLTPTTIPKSFADLAQYVSNNPQSAQAGAFLKQYQDYANKLSDDANGVIKDKYSRVIEARKGSLGKDNYETLKSQYLDPLNSKKSGAPAAPKVGSVEDGHVFLGGDPSDPKSWKAQ